MPLDGSADLSGLELDHNRREQIQAELLDTNIVRAIARSVGLTDNDLTTIQIAKKPQRTPVEIYQVSRSDRAFTVLGKRLKTYVAERQRGHTKECLLAATTNSSIRLTDPDLQVLATNRPMVPLSWLQKSDSGARTNRAGQVVHRKTSYTSDGKQTKTNETVYIPKVDETSRHVSFHHLDGSIGWRYSIWYLPDGSIDSFHEAKCDATELDPKFQALMKEVDDACRAEMKRNGSDGQFGSVHTFWRLKKAALKSKGIEWRSPGELNPNIHYD